MKQKNAKILNIGVLFQNWIRNFFKNFKKYFDR